MKIRVLSIFLCMVLVLSLSVTAMAEYSEGQVILIDEDTNISEEVYMFEGAEEKLVYPLVWTDAGHHGKGIDFTGVKPHLRFDTTAIASATALTLNTWVYWRTCNTGSLVYGCSGANGHFKVVCSDSEYGEVMTFAYGLYNQDVYAVSETALPVGEWAMVTVCVSAEEMALYLNGEEIASALPAVTPDQLKLDLFRFASSFWGPESFDGVFDDASLWTRALSAEEVAALYTDTKAAE